MRRLGDGRFFRPPGSPCAGGCSVRRYWYVFHPIDTHPPERADASRLCPLDGCTYAAPPSYTGVRSGCGLGRGYPCAMYRAETTFGSPATLGFFP